MNQILCRVWGNLVPADDKICNVVNDIMRDWCLSPCAKLDGDILNFFYEGVVFPLDEILEKIQLALDLESSGKIDLCDLEKWTLTRATFQGKKILLASSGLNNVLAYSGY